MSQDGQENISWSKIRRHGNDELPTGKDAVKIIRTVQKEIAPISARKPAVTKIVKLSYEPNKTGVKSMKSAKRNLSLAIYNEGKQSDEPINNKNEGTQITKTSDKPAKTVNTTVAGQSVSVVRKDPHENFLEKKSEQLEQLLEIKDVLKDNSSILNEKVATTSKSIDVMGGDETAINTMKTRTTSNVSTLTNVGSVNDKLRKRSKSVHSIQKMPGAQFPSNANAVYQTRSLASLKIRSKSENNVNMAAKNDESKSQRRKKRPRIPYPNLKDNKKQTETEKGIIKERLENLKKNTREILIQNIKKTKGNKAKKMTHKAEINVPAQDFEAYNLNIKINGKTSQETNSRSESKKYLGTFEEKDNTKQNSQHLPKKFGLLRVIDKVVDSAPSNVELCIPKSSLVPDHKYENYRYDRIRSLESSAGKVDIPVSVNSKNSVSHTPLSNLVENGKRELPTSNEHANVTSCENLPQPLCNKTGLELLVPDVKLKSETKHESTTPKFDREGKKISRPHWFKQTSVETYPYSFIMAVRKKLEAVANPILTSKVDVANKSEKSKNKIVSSSFSVLKQEKARYSNQPISNISMHRIVQSEAKGSYTNLVNKNVGVERSEIEDIKDFSSDDQISSNRVTQGGNLAIKSQKTSRNYTDIMSNFTKITLEDPESNTISEVSSIKSESINPIFSSTKISHHARDKQSDTTTSSVAISSPEKRKSRQFYRKMHKVQSSDEDGKPSQFCNTNKFSPLSTEKIDSLRIKSSSVPEHVNVKRGEGYDSTSIHTDLKSASTKSITQAESVNFDELLISFNKSLSQVMEVNEQLHSSLQRKSKSHRISESQSFDRYTSDFEGFKSSSTRSYDQKHLGSDLKSSGSLMSSTQQNIILSHTKSNKTLNTIKSSSISTVISGLSTRNESTVSQPIFAEIINETMSGTLIETARSSQKFNDNTSDECKVSIENTRKLSPTQEKPAELEFSKDSLDMLQEQDDCTKSKSTSNPFSIRNINFSRGEAGKESTPAKILEHSSESTSRETLSGPPGYLRHEQTENKMNPQTFNSSLGSDIFAVFNQSEFELSIASRNGSLSETNVTYSSIGFYEKLISTETNKSEYLTALLRKREKALLDRTKGQIAWLEVQKGQYRSKGLLAQISTIKKKQRAILLKMEKERDEIKRILKSKDKCNNSSQQISERMSQIVDAVSLKRKQVSDSAKQSNRILRGFELQRSQKLEMILKKREEDLRKRREYVEKLVEWHRRLDREEEEVIELEEMLFKHHSEITKKHAKKKEQKLLKINKSLKILQSIACTTDDNEDIRDSVCVTGAEINRLWQRLTGRKEIRFDETGQYKLTKEDLEKLYESAKMVVLKNFNEGEKIKFLLEHSNLDKSNSIHRSEESLVPCLNLNICSNESEKENFVESDFTVSTSRKSNKSISEKNISIISVTSSTIQDNFQSNSNAINENRLEFGLGETNSQIESSRNKDNGALERVGSMEKPLLNQDSSYLNFTSYENPSVLFEREMLNERQLTSFQQFDKKISPDRQQVSTSNKSSTIPTDLKLIANEKGTSDEISEISKEIKTIGSDVKSLNDISENNSSKTELLETTPGISANVDSTSTGQKTISIVSDNVESQNTLKTFEHQSFASQIIETGSIISTNGSQLMSCKTHESKHCVIESQETFNEVSDQKILSSGSHGSTAKTTIDEVTKNINSSNTSKMASEVSEDIELNEKCIEFEEEINNRTFVKSSPEESGSQESKDLAESAVDIIQSAISMAKNTNSHNTYDDDLFENNTLLDDVSLPSFEETMNDTKSIANTLENFEDAESGSLTEKKSRVDSPSELEQRLIVIDESMKELSDTFERVLSPDKSSQSSETTVNSRHSVNQETDGISVHQSSDDTCAFNSTSSDENNSELSNAKMPDIVNEVELRRCQQAEDGNKIRSIEQSVPFVFLREIPNKPPPPYVPPAHGSPMTTIFPSEERIRDIIYRRTKELLNEIMQQDVSGSSVLDENITNIYERIILDICKECVSDIQPSKDEFWLFPNYTKPLALFNPPDRLACVQEFVYKRIRKLLGMDKKNSSDRNSILGIGRRKRDHVDEILIQELYEEEYKWTNFDLEEKEVRSALVEEIINDLVSEVIDDLEVKYSEKDFNNRNKQNVNNGNNLKLE